MKHKIKITLTLLAVFFLTSCKDPDISERTFDEEKFLSAISGFPDSFTYDKIEYIGDYDIGDDGTVYAIQNFPELDGSVRCELHCFSPDGAETADLGQIPASTILWDNGKLYLTIMEQGMYYLSAYDFESGEITRLADAKLQPENTVIIGNTIYYTGTTEDRRNMNELIKGTDFEYDGTLIYKYKLGDTEAEPIDIEYPVSISETVTGELCIYAVDENGPYFKTGINGRKNYNDLGKIGSFGFLNENNFAFCSDIKSVSLNMGRLDSNSIYSELVENAGAYRIKARSDYVFYINGFTGNLERINCLAFDKQNEIIRFLSPEYTFNKPFGIGYMTDYKELDNESFALSVLSQDSGFDIFMMNSHDGYAANIRDKCSFYPLSDIPNVREYLDKCFPYLKKAATDEEGNVWMLPIGINLPMIVYNKDSCATAGIDFGSKFTIEGLIDICENAYNSEYKNGYDVQPYQLTQNLLMQYMAFNNSFDMPEFRKFAEFAKEKINLSQLSSCLTTVNEAMNNLYMPESEKAFLFSYLSDIDSVEWLSDFESFDFCAVPGISENFSPIATCTFITVNPSSSNLKEALNYVSDLAEYLSDQNNSFMLLSEKATYTEKPGIKSVYDIVSSAEIGFYVSEEIYLDTYIKYLEDEISLESFIAETDRKLSAYLNE